MAIMGRKKKAVARGWEVINKQRAEESRRVQEATKKDEKITAKEHETRVKILKEIGLIK